MKPDSRRYQRFENDQGVIYLVPRPAPRWHRVPFWRDFRELAYLAAAVVAAIGAGAAVYLFR